MKKNPERAKGDTNWIDSDALERAFPYLNSTNEEVNNCFSTRIKEDDYDMLIKDTIDTDDPKFVKFVKRIENMARSSMELKKYISYLKENTELDKCHFLPIASVSNSSIEIHHHPYTMYDITSIILRKNIAKIKNGYKISLMQILEEIVQVHYDNKVGLIPLSKTMHDAAHADEILIPISFVYGQVDVFTEEYKDYIEKGLIRKIKFLKDCENENMEDIRIRNASKTQINILKNKLFIESKDDVEDVENEHELDINFNEEEEVFI